mmetsp:Transcript_32479/g.79493  ORF Transcript_32479/g.79493 Transcript_32479/m.79493 type:complete len:253 (-) Transcript_32479:539-1297(-)
MSLKQPVTQVRLTNVAVVRLKRHGKRFEIACYKNKVAAYRAGTEKDLDEVLQIDNTVFTNVSKGVAAKTADLQKAFGTTDVHACVLEILQKGEVQVSDKERSSALEAKFAEVANLAASKCVDKKTKRPVTVTMVERAMRETLHFAVVPGKSAKSQALEVIKQLKEHLDIDRAQMRLHVSAPSKVAKPLKEKLDALVTEWEDEQHIGKSFEGTCLVDPGHFRAMNDAVSSLAKGQGSVEVLNMAVVRDGDEIL